MCLRKEGGPGRKRKILILERWPYQEGRTADRAQNLDYETERVRAGKIKQEGSMKEVDLHPATKTQKK